MVSIRCPKCDADIDTYDIRSLKDKSASYVACKQCKTNYVIKLQEYWKSN